MKISIKKEIFDKFNLKLGVIAAKNIDNKPNNDVFHLLEETQRLTKLRFNPDSISTHHLISPVNTIYEEFGYKPHKYKSSVEELMHSALKSDINVSNLMIDICNYVSLKHIIPIGAVDTDKIKGDIIISIDKDVIIEDKEKKLFEAWFFKQKNAKITSKTKNALILIAGLKPVRRSKLDKVLYDIEQLLIPFSKEIRTMVLDKNEQKSIV